MEQMKTLGRTYLEKKIDSIKKNLIKNSEIGIDNITITPINDGFFLPYKDCYGKEEIKKVTGVILELLKKELGIDAKGKPS